MEAKLLEDRLLAAVGGMGAFRRSFDARAHYPGRAAARAISDAASLWAGGLDVLRAVEAPRDVVEAWEARFLRKWLAYQAAGSRVMNWFITGPARFPVARNEKRMATERTRRDEFYAHAMGAEDWARRHARSAQKAELSAQAATVEHEEVGFPGGRLVRNATLDRVQLVFDGRPSTEVIARLKSRAFRWSPREGAWQRQLTRNGLWAAEAIVAEISKATAQPSGGDR